MVAIDRIRVSGKITLGLAAFFAAGLVLGVVTRGGQGRVEVPVVMTETVTVVKPATPVRRHEPRRKRHVLPNDPLSKIDYGAWAF